MNCTDPHYVHHMCLNICLLIKKQQGRNEFCPKPAKPASCVKRCLLHSQDVMVYNEKPNELYLHAANLCSHLLFFGFFRLLVAPLSTLSDFQISVCRGMCQFRTDDLVFAHAQSYKHWKAPLHTLCEHCKNSSFYINSVYSTSGCGKCQLWNWLIFNYRWLLHTAALQLTVIFSWHLIGAETAWPILFGENVYFICVSSDGGPELNTQCCDGSSQSVMQRRLLTTSQAANSSAGLHKATKRDSSHRLNKFCN